MFEFAPAWMARLEVLVKPQTADGYRRVMRLHVLPVLGHLPLRELRRKHIRDWVAVELRAGVAASTVGYHLAVLQSLLREAVEDELIQVSPAVGIARTMRLVRLAPRRIKCLEPDQLKAVLEECQRSYPRAYPVLLLLACTGLRIGEVLGLAWNDLDFEAGRVYIKRQLLPDHSLSEPKSLSGVREVDLPSVCIAPLQWLRVRQRELSMRRGQSPPVYVAHYAKPTRNTTFSIRRYLRLSCERAGVPVIVPHGLRHTYASIQASRGANLRWLQYQLGHASIKQTEIYMSHLPAHDRDRADEFGASMALRVRFS